MSGAGASGAPGGLVLALDAATPLATVALVGDGVLLAERATRVRAGAGGRLLRDVDAVLADLGCVLGDVGLLVVGVGPGSFTGIRVAMATARTLAWTAGIPAVGVVSLEALAWSVGAGVPSGRLIAPFVDARKGEVYGALYRVAGPGRPQVVVPPAVGRAEAVLAGVLAEAGAEPVLVVGDGVRAWPDAFSGGRVEVAPPALDDPRGLAFAVLGALVAADGAVPLPELQPVYLRRSEAEISIGPPTGASLLETRTAG